MCFQGIKSFLGISCFDVADAHASSENCTPDSSQRNSLYRKVDCVSFQLVPSIYIWVHFKKRHLTNTNMPMENLACMRTYLLLKISFQSCIFVLLQVMLMWFKPYGHVLELWPLEDPELHEETERPITGPS